MKVLFLRHCSSFASSSSTTPLSSFKELQIIQHCKSGSLLHGIQVLNSIDCTKISNKPFIYASLLQTCTKVLSFSHGLQFHAHVIKSGLENDRFVGNSLLALYFKTGTDFVETRRVFDGLHFRDVISWTSMISGYVRVGKSKSSLELFVEMLDLGIEPNAFTLSSVIKACSDIGELKLGRCFHGMAMRLGFEYDSNHVISTSLVDMYGRNQKFDYANKVFDQLTEPDVICFTSLISAFTRNDLYAEALGFFHLMQRKHSLSPDGYTFGTVLTAIGNLGKTKSGKEVHAKVISSGLSGNVVVESSLVDMYGKCKLVNDARQVFDRMPKKNSVSWSALLGGYCQNGHFSSVLNLCREIKEIDLYSFGTIIRACAGLSAINQGKEVHCQYVRKGGLSDIIVESALVDLYSKCGAVDFAYRIFIQMSTVNLITWNSMISGFAQNGRGTEALKVFQEMTKKGTKPDCISFIGVLFACSHAGFVEEGRNYFSLMTKHFKLKAGIEHYSCMVNLLGRAGLLEEAEKLIMEADCINVMSLWEVLLGASANCANSATAERIAKKVMELKPGYHLSYVYLANHYRNMGRWDDATAVRKLMEDRGVKKTRGSSCLV